MKKEYLEKKPQEELTKFREEFNRPIYKRYSPIILIEKLSSSLNFISQYIQYSKTHRGEFTKNNP